MLSLLWLSIALGQDPTLDQAIQAVRNWVGDKQANNRPGGTPKLLYLSDGHL